MAECAYLQSAVNAKVGEANELAEEVNRGGEEAQHQCAAKCQEYNECRATKEETYATVCGPCAWDASG